MHWYTGAEKHMILKEHLDYKLENRNNEKCGCFARLPVVLYYGPAPSMRALSQQVPSQTHL